MHPGSQSLQLQSSAVRPPGQERTQASGSPGRGQTLHLGFALHGRLHLLGHSQRGAPVPEGVRLPNLLGNGPVTPEAEPPCPPAQAPVQPRPLPLCPAPCPPQPSSHPVPGCRARAGPRLGSGLVPPSPCRPPPSARCPRHRWVPGSPGWVRWVPVPHLVRCGEGAGAPCLPCCRALSPDPQQTWNPGVRGPAPSSLAAPPPIGSAEPGCLGPSSLWLGRTPHPQQACNPGIRGLAPSSLGVPPPIGSGHTTQASRELLPAMPSFHAGRGTQASGLPKFGQSQRPLVERTGPVSPLP